MMVMLAKIIVKCDVNDATEALEVESLVATAVAQYLQKHGHPGNATAVLKSLSPNQEVAGPQPAK